MSNSISLLILLNIIAMILETLEFFKGYSLYFSVFEIVSVVLFLIEYIARLYSYKLYKRYDSLLGFMRSPMMIFDAIVLFPAIISFLFPGLFDLRILRVIRVFRIFRLYKYSNIIDRILSITLRHTDVLISAFSFIFMGVVTSSTLMYFAEKDIQPEAFSSIPAAMYWAIITISTVGYGDISPVTNIGKLIAVFTTVAGVAIYALPTSILGAAFYAELMSKESYVINKLREEQDHLRYLLKNSEREKNILRKMLKKSRVEERDSKDDGESFFQKSKFKFLKFFK
jgi:voltage-gated potassium channel